MIPNNNLSVLPWYSDIQFQNHRKSYAYGNVYPLFVPRDKLIPFQIIRNTRANNTFTVKAFDKNGIEKANLTSQLAETGLTVKRFQSLGYDVILFPALFPFISNLTEGLYYLSLSDGVETWYSEVFTSVDSVSNYLKIEWFDIDDFVFDAGRIVYSEGFKNILYLCAEIGKPEYIFEEDGETRDGYFFPEKQISEKTYKFTFLAPEYLCDVLRIVRMSDYVNIYKDSQVYNCDTFLITPKWQTQGDLASVETEFQTATVIKKIGRGFVQTSGGDFNNDFNNDYN